MQGFAVRYVAKVGHQNIKYVLYKYSDMWKLLGIP